MAKCEFVKQPGERCQAIAMRGTDRCFSHNPAAAESKLAAVAKGGRNRRTRALAVVPAKPVRIRTIGEVPDPLPRTIEQPRNGVFDVELVRTFGCLSGIAAKLVETTQLEERMTNVDPTDRGLAITPEKRSVKANGKPSRRRAKQETALRPTEVDMSSIKAAMRRLRSQPPSESGAVFAIGDMFGFPNELGVRIGKSRLEPVLAEIAPRDPLERMLIEQLVCCHERILQLTRRSGIEDRLDDALAIHEQCDRTMNAYRRGMLTFKEYRNVRREVPLVAIQQVNQVTPAEGGGAAGLEAGGEKNMTNELGAN